MSQKGGSYERELCRTLSLWWSDGADDFVFTRTAGSGGMATARARKGKRTEGHGSDIAAANPFGAAFTRLVSVESKRGFSTHSIQDLITPYRGKQPKYVEFIDQAQWAAEREGVPYWMLVHRRDGRQAIVVFPRAILSRLMRDGGAIGAFDEVRPLFLVSAHCPGVGHVRLAMTTLAEFTARFKRQHFLAVGKALKREGLL